MQKIILKLKEKYPHIKLVSIAPCHKQYSKWKPEDQRNWYDIAYNSDDFFFAEENEYTPSCMQYRNELMVDRSDFCLAVWDGTAGGTANCVQYATEQGVPIKIINPINYN